MNDMEDGSGPNFSKLIPASINEEISDFIDGGNSGYGANRQNQTTNDSTDIVDSETDAKAEVSDQKPHIGSIDEVPADRVFNNHIKTGYRINFKGWRQICGSLFAWHNETMNIWTHLVGFIVYFAVLLIIGFSAIGEDVTPDTSQTASTICKFFSEPTPWDFGLVESQRSELTLVMSTIEQSLFAQSIADGSYTPRFHTGFAHSEQVSKWPIVAYLFCALFCLGCSTACHWFYDKSPKMGRIVAALDYWGITILIQGSVYPFISYRYACGPLIIYRYVFVCILTVLTIGCMIVTVNESFLKPTPKAILFISFGAFCLVPTITLFILNDDVNGMSPGLDPFSWAVMFYLIGMTFYMTKFPERMSRSGKFDLLFNSHQIHHLCVLVGVTISFLESFEVYEKRLAFVCPDQQAAVPVA